MAAPSSRLRHASAVTAAVCASFLLLAFCQVANGQTNTSAPAALSPDFYNVTCPQFETLVQQRLANLTATNARLIPTILRMFFHDSFVQGMDGSVLVNATKQSERFSVPNQTIVGFPTIDDIKGILEAACPGVVSCTDIIVAATKFGIVATQGPTIPFAYGRFDSLNSSKALADASLPAPTSNSTVIEAQFLAKGMTGPDLIALSGGHTIGVSHCASFFARLGSNTTKPAVPQDKELNNTLAASLRQQCPTSGAATLVVQDPVTPNVFDNQYYVNLLNGQGLFVSDESIPFKGSSSKGLVVTYATNQTRFFVDFSAAMIKLSLLGVKTAANGQIRNKCFTFNT